MAGIHTAILEILSDYRGKEIPLEFVATKLCRSTDGIMPYVERLEKAGIVRTNGDYVSYASC